MAISPQNNEKTIFYTGKLYGLTGMTCGLSNHISWGHVTCHVTRHVTSQLLDDASPGSTLVVSPQWGTVDAEIKVPSFCADSCFCIHSTPLLSQQHLKDPAHSAKSAGGRLQLNTIAPYVRGVA